MTLSNHGLAGLLVGALLLCAPTACRAPSPGEAPRVIRDVPAFSLTDQGGQPFGSDQLAGEAYVVSFFFTSCPTICPRIQGAMLELQAALKKQGHRCRLVSITVDPSNDTPEKLATHAREFGADLERWTFLTGDPKEVRASVTKAFVTHMGDMEETAPGLMDIGHGGHLILVDAQGRMRGTYEAVADDTQARILADLGRL